LLPCRTKPMHDPTSAAGSARHRCAVGCTDNLSPSSSGPAVRESLSDSPDNALRYTKCAIHAFPRAGLLFPVAQYQNAGSFRKIRRTETALRPQHSAMSCTVRNRSARYSFAWGRWCSFAYCSFEGLKSAGLCLCCISGRTNLKASFPDCEGTGVYDRCTIKSIIVSFWNLWTFVDSVTYSGSAPTSGSNPTLTNPLARPAFPTFACSI
jgi:hypothetical protein